MTIEPQHGGSWVVTCTIPSRLSPPPSVRLLVETELTRVPAKQQAEAKALIQLEALRVRNPEVIESRPSGEKEQE